MENRKYTEGVRVVLKKILDRYKDINVDDILYFSPVYYPIANVEMSMEEKTFEDFESVQYYVLKLYYLGQNNSEVIASLMGLRISYVEKILKLLYAYGHIDESGVTDLGVESINSKKKVIKNSIKQIVQVDALNLKMLKINRLIESEMLNSKKETNRHFGHLDYVDRVDTEVLISQLNENGYDNFINKRYGVFNRNLLGINSVEFRELKYSKSYLMMLRKKRTPIIFSKVYDKTNSSFEDRFIWVPQGVNKEEVIKDYNLDSDVVINSPIAINYINTIIIAIEDELRKVTEVNVIENIVRNFSFNPDYIEIKDDENGRTIVKITEESFTKYYKFIVDLLLDINAKSKHITSFNYLNGKIIIIETDDKKVLELAALCTNAANSMGIKTLKEELSKKFDGKSVVNLTSEIIVYLSEVMETI